ASRTGVAETPRLAPRVGAECSSPSASSPVMIAVRRRSKTVSLRLEGLVNGVRDSGLTMLLLEVIAWDRPPGFPHGRPRMRQLNLPMTFPLQCRIRVSRGCVSLYPARDPADSTSRD